MTRYLSAYIIAACIFGILDYIWLSNMVPRFYRPVLGNLLAVNTNPVPAVIFYPIYVFGIFWFAVRPGLMAGHSSVALINGALLGLIAFATYNLTNQATLKAWTTKITLLDCCWGVFITGFTAAITCAVVLRFASTGE